MPQALPDAKPPKLLDRVRATMRLNRYSPRTEATYVDWIRRFIRFHGVRHPQEMGAEEVKAFLSHLAMQMNVAASTQNQAFSALLFLYQEVLKQRLPWMDDIVRSKRPKKVPVVFTQEEARQVLSRIGGTPRLFHRSCVRVFCCSVQENAQNVDLLVSSVGGTIRFGAITDISRCSQRDFACSQAQCSPLFHCSQ
jgi:hypothetical protein